ncbi:hypothetical protein ACHHYP_15591, partial [Achlya hypogyna]
PTSGSNSGSGVTPAPTPGSNSGSGVTPAPTSGSNSGGGVTPAPTSGSSSNSGATPVPTPTPESVFVVGGSVTEGSLLTLGCPLGKKLGSIVFASYGNPSGKLLDFQTGSCDASTSMEVVAASCIGDTKCQLWATDDVFGNPCAGTFKALSVEAQCVDATDSLIGGTVQEHQVLTLKCPPNQVVAQVAFASFGTPAGTPGTFASGSCHADTAASVVHDLCAGRPSCAVLADSSVFGDPCLGVSKFLSVALECESASNLLRQ